MMRTVANYLGIMTTWFAVALVGCLAIIDAIANGPTLNTVVVAAMAVVIGTLISLIWGVEGAG